MLVYLLLSWRLGAPVVRCPDLIDSDRTFGVARSVELNCPASVVYENADKRDGAVCTSGMIAGDAVSLIPTDCC